MQDAVGNKKKAGSIKLPPASCLLPTAYSHYAIAQESEQTGGDQVGGRAWIAAVAVGAEPEIEIGGRLQECVVVWRA